VKGKFDITFGRFGMHIEGAGKVLVATQDHQLETVSRLRQGAIASHG
jgi:hypothetical protein